MHDSLSRYAIYVYACGIFVAGRSFSELVDIGLMLRVGVS